METARACAAAAGGAGQSAAGSPACREVPRRGGASRVGGELRERAARVKRRGRFRLLRYAFLVCGKAPAPAIHTVVVGTPVVVISSFFPVSKAGLVYTSSELLAVARSTYLLTYVCVALVSSGSRLYPVCTTY